jgi:hypothetical protein
MTRLVLGKMPVCRRHSRPKQSLARNLLQAQGRLRNNLLEHLYPFKGHRQLGVDHRIDRERIGQTCEHVFQTRNTHPWPPPLELPGHWVEPIARLIRELNLPVTDAHAGITQVRQFVDRILF